MKLPGISEEDFETARDSFDLSTRKLELELTTAARRALADAMRRSPVVATLWLAVFCAREIWYDVKDAQSMRDIRERRKEREAQGG